MESIARGQSNLDTTDSRTIDDLNALHTPLRAQQISLIFRTAHEFNWHRRKGNQQGDPNAVEWYDKMLKGEFNVSDDGFKLRDHEFAEGSRQVVGNRPIRR